MGNILIILSILFNQQPSTFYNVEQLRRGTHGLNAGDVIVTQGFYTPNDGGGATYNIDNSGATEDSATIIKIGSGNLRAKLLVNIPDVRQLGVKAGTGLTDAERKRNWRRFRIAKANYQSVNLPGDTIQVYVSKNDSIVVNSDFNLIGKGRNKTIISTYPKLKGYKGNCKLFYCTTKGDFKVKDLSVYGYVHRWKYETYAAVIRPGGDVNAIKVSDTTTVRTGFWTNLTVGDTIFAQRINTAISLFRTVVSFDSTTRIIQTSADFTGIADDYQVASTYVMRKFNSNISTSNINTYGKSWNTTNYEESFLVQASAVTTKSKIVFENVDIIGIDRIFFMGTYWGDLEINNCKLQANTIAVNWSGVTDTAQTPNLIMKGVEMYDCGTVIVGSTFDGNNLTYGSGVYIQPHIQPYVENSNFHDNNGTCFRNFGSSNPTPRNWRGYFSNTVWRDNSEVSLILSGRFPSILNDCRFYGISSIYPGNSTEFNNCYFESTTINCNTNSTPADAVNDRYKFNFKNCVFREFSSFLPAEWNNSELLKSDCVLENCDFYTTISSSYPWVSFMYGDLTIKDSRIKYSTVGSKSHRAIIESFSPSISGAKRGKIIVDGLRFDSITTTPIVHHNTSVIHELEVEIKNSDLKSWYIATPHTLMPIRIRNSKIYSVSNSDGSVWIYDLENKISRGEVRATKRYKDYPFKTNRDLNNCLLAYTTANRYLVSDTVKSIIISTLSKIATADTNSTYIPINFCYEGEIFLTATDDFDIIPYGIDSLSNIVGSDTVHVLEGETVKLKGNAHRCLAPSQTAQIDTVGTGNGTTKDFTSFHAAAGAFTNIYSTSAFVPGTLIVSAAGITGRDDGNGKIVGTGIVGYVNYLTKSWWVKFTTAPGSSVPIVFTYQKYQNPIHAGYWTIIK